ncbi:MAG: DUF2281 domain-containing protein [Myxococcaceae bacterium]
MKAHKVADLISEHVEHLPDNLQAEVLDFVQYLEAKRLSQAVESERKESLQISLQNAMKDMGEDEIEYSEKDIKEFF